MSARRPLRDCFEEKYVVEPNTGCWLWTDHCGRRGYAKIWDNDLGRVETGSRAAWKIYRGPIPEGLCVLHTCDTPACVNPEHLFVGTHGDNTRDKLKKKRHRFGVEHGNAKLTPEIVRQIRARVAAGEYERDVAKAFGISQRTVHCVKEKITWKHVV